MDKFQNYENAIEAARHGSKHAIAKLLEEFEPLLSATSRRYGTDYRHMDAHQEACLAFLKAIFEWRDELGVPFPAFARSKVRGDVRTAMRRIWRYEDRRMLAKDRPDDEESVNELWDTAAYDAPDIEIALDMTTLVLHAGLSEREKLYVCWLMEGRTLREMAEIAHVSVETVKTWRKRSLQKLRRKVEAVELEWDS